MIEHINWYPGHMKKTRELIQENLKLVDAAVEVIDARIPLSSRNPIIDELVKNKTRIVVLNKSDLSNEEANRQWEAYFQKQGNLVLSMNCMSGSGASRLLKLLTRLQDEKNKNQIRKKPYRLLIAGVPNVGKSSLINRLTGKKSAQTGDRPGVTRGKQWLNLPGNMQLLDTPGILWPKFEDPKAGLNLAFCGSIKDEILDMADLALELISVLRRDYPELLTARYKLEELGETPLETMEAMAGKRGCILPGKKIDYERIANVVLDEFRAGRIGRITLEQAPAAEEEKERTKDTKVKTDTKAKREEA
ncbi:MAG: ribosome biogenesis GTPase YlqF [Firmicutes bacterium]|nr:ribosome biogenesis GTPase YlqF [Bacillota bacterium]